MKSRFFLVLLIVAILAEFFYYQKYQGPRVLLAPDDSLEPSTKTIVAQATATPTKSAAKIQMEVNRLPLQDSALPIFPRKRIHPAYEKPPNGLEIEFEVINGLAVA